MAWLKQPSVEIYIMCFNHLTLLPLLLPILFAHTCSVSYSDSPHILFAIGCLCCDIHSMLVNTFASSAGMMQACIFQVFVHVCLFVCVYLSAWLLLVVLALKSLKKMLIGDNQCEWLIRAGGRQRDCHCHLTVNEPLMVNPSPVFKWHTCHTARSDTCTRILRMKIKEDAHLATHTDPYSYKHKICHTFYIYTSNQLYCQCQSQFSILHILFYSVSCNSCLYIICNFIWASKSWG